MDESVLHDLQMRFMPGDHDRDITALLRKLAFDNFGLLETDSFLDGDCHCLSCSEKRKLVSSDGETDVIEECWVELHQYIRVVYSLCTSGSLKGIDEVYQSYMKDIVSRLIGVCDPHHIYLRLESQVKDLIIEIKVLLLQLLDRMSYKPKLPYLFLTGLLDRYRKIMKAATVVSPVLSPLETEHLNKFSLNWKLLNQRLFQIIVYGDVFFQTCIPLLLNQAANTNDSEESKKLINAFFKFDHEMKMIDNSWIEIESLMVHYLRTHTFMGNKLNSNFGNINIQELISDMCECDGYSKSPAVSQLEVVDFQTAHKSHNHELFPQLHETKKEDKISLDENNTQRICPQLCDHQLWQESREKDLNKINTIADPLYHPNIHHHLPIEQPSTGCSNGGKKPLIEKEETRKREEHLSESSTPDPRHCDCCYCEVFGPNASSPSLSKNYKQMRERLRLLLNRKKNRCKGKPLSLALALRKQQTNEDPLPTQVSQDPRALEDLVDFIEGNEVKCRDEKKAAKKARQKEKKRILEEQQREAMERERLLREAMEKKRLEDEALAAARAAAEARAHSKKKKGSKSSGSNISNPPKAESQDKMGPQMVTIKRVMDNHSSEPTVTITLRGATPNQDKVLYTLLNGQVCKVKDKPVENNPPLKKPYTGKNNKPSGKNQPLNPNVPKKIDITYNNNKNTKNNKNKEPIIAPSLSHSDSYVKPNELTNLSSIQVNNALNTMTKKTAPSFNIADIKLPPGITITKVDPTSVQTRSPKIQEDPARKNYGTSSEGRQQPTEVIVVTTGKNKEPSTANSDIVSNAENVKKKKKKKQSSNNPLLPTITNNKKNSYPGLEIQPIKTVDPKKEKDIVNRMSVLTISPYANNKLEENESSKKKKKKKKTSPSTSNNEDWKLLDSVFAPKDIDLDDGDMDDAERELEAFKRFCFQSVPPERKEKVHLNIKDIVLKKKSSHDY